MSKPLPTYDKSQEVDLLCNFFQYFQDEHGLAIYQDQLSKLPSGQLATVTIHLDHIAAFPSTAAQNLVQRIEENTPRYQHICAEAIDKALQFIIPEDNALPIECQSVFDMHVDRRLAQIRASRDNNIDVTSVPLQLLQRFDIQILPRSNQPIQRFREIGAAHLGHLVYLRGIVVKVSDAASSVQVQAYICTSCGYESYQTVEGKSFTPLSQCPSAECQRDQSKGNLRPQLRSSKLLPQQTIILQELQSEVPVGGIARTMKLMVNSPSLINIAKPGALVTVAGVFMPERFSGFRQIRAGLLVDHFLAVSLLQLAKKNYSQMEISTVVAHRLRSLQARVHAKTIYEAMARAIAPEIYGQLDAKKALLLAMVGGVTQSMSDGMKIRGDINVMLVGDPGMAKSQLIKFITRLAPRSIYTTGKGASGVGLTAAVTRDPKTGEIGLEGGALVLADNGICCIDEFDKMDETDRTAIHEVMEQQTVSISKAGMTTSLNARTTVIAAANPAFGRYNVKRSLAENMNMPPALLSRFDLVFVLLDQAAQETDLALAKHILHVHKTGTAPANMQNGDDNIYVAPELRADVGDHDMTNEQQREAEHLASETFRAYISHARTFRPVINSESLEFIAKCYVDMRQITNLEDQAASVSETGNNSFRNGANTSNSRERFCTARQLLGIVRIAQAHARLHLRDVVEREDVQEAMRLLVASKCAITGFNPRKTADSPAQYNERVMTALMNTLKSPDTFYKLHDIVTALSSTFGMVPDQVESIILQHSALGKVYITRDGQRISRGAA